MIRTRPGIPGQDETGELVRTREIWKEPQHEVQLTLSLAQEFGHHSTSDLKDTMGVSSQ